MITSTKARGIRLYRDGTSSNEGRKLRDCWANPNPYQRKKELAWRCLVFLTAILTGITVTVTALTEVLQM